MRIMYIMLNNIITSRIRKTLVLHQNYSSTENQSRSSEASNGLHYLPTFYSETWRSDQHAYTQMRLHASRCLSLVFQMGFAFWRVLCSSYFGFLSVRFFVSFLIFCFSEFGSILMHVWIQLGNLGIDFWMIFACRPKSGPRAAKSTQERPRAAQERPRAAQERPRAAQERPRAAQECPRAPKSGPRAAQECSRAA